MKFFNTILSISVLIISVSFYYKSSISHEKLSSNFNKVEKVEHSDFNLVKQHPKREFRSAWITTFTNLDWPSKKGLDSESQQEELINILNQLEASGINAVVFQVRASADAFYESKYSPWSEWLTGTQGKAPEPFYDPLDFVINECHKRNMELHAWFNPFRGVSHTRFSSVDENHISKTQNDWFFKYGESKYFNPGIPEVREHIKDVVLEVVKNYDIDGIHFDDYFYPYTIKKQELPDQETFITYGKQNFSDIKDWRRFNVNELIRELSVAVKETKPYVKFGVSPLAIWRNKKQDPTGSETNSSQTSFDNLYCDTKLWMQKGWVDYIAPQCYWSTNNRYANYNELLEWWSENNGDKHLYIGHALYKMNKKERHSYSPEELLKQIELSRLKPNVHGSIYFRAKAFNHNHQNIIDTLRSKSYKYHALVPSMKWIDSIPPAEPYGLQIKNNEKGLLLKWKAKKDANPMNNATYFVIYRFKKDAPYDLSKSSNIVATTRELSYLDTTAVEDERYVYYVTSVDRLHNESELFAMKSIKRK